MDVPMPKYFPKTRNGLDGDNRPDAGGEFYLEDTPEAVLMARCRTGDPEAFADLIKPYRAHLFTYLFRFCGDRFEAEDLFQETLVKLWLGLKAKPVTRFGGWLFKIAHNVARDRHRYHKVRQMVQFTDVPPQTAAATNPENRLDAHQLAARIGSVLSQLPEKQRHVYLLRRHSSLSFREIAQLRGEPLSTVLGHMAYAVAKFKKVVREYHGLV